MKAAKGKYISVRAITKEEAIELADELFNAKGDKLMAEGDKLCAKGNKLWAEGDKLRAEGSKLRAEGSKLMAEGDKLCAKLARQYCARIPDWRALNFIAADREDGVYCFVWTRREIWFYDGENCPNPETVEVVWKVGLAYGLPFTSKSDLM